MSDYVPYDDSSNRRFLRHWVDSAEPDQERWDAVQSTVRALCDELDLLEAAHQELRNAVHNTLNFILNLKELNPSRDPFSTDPESPREILKYLWKRRDYDDEQLGKVGKRKAESIEARRRMGFAQ